MNFSGTIVKTEDIIGISPLQQKAMQPFGQRQFFTVYTKHQGITIESNPFLDESDTEKMRKFQLEYAQHYMSICVKLDEPTGAYIENFWNSLQKEIKKEGA